MRKVSKVQLSGHRVGFWHIVGQCFSVGPLINVALLLGIVAATVVPLLALYGTFVPFPDFPERCGLLAGVGAVLGVTAWVWRLRLRKRR
jgi:hypothetical protein